MTTELLLARHGETAWSRDDLFCGRTDVALSEAGIRQAQALAQAVAAQPLAAVYCSPLGRAVATAQWVAAAGGWPLTPVEALREMDFGAWEGRARADLIANDGERYRAWQQDAANIAPTDGESAAQVAARVVPVVQTLVQRHAGQVFLIVAHKTVNRILLCHLLGLPLGEYRQRITQDTAALNRLRFAADGTLADYVLNDGRHLQPAA